MTRRRFSEREVLATLLHQGVKITCFRTGEEITLDNVNQLEREHLHEIKLDGPDVPGNCRYSLKAAHKVVTFGTPATTAGSSLHRIAKATQPTRIEKFAVRKQAVDQRREPKQGAWGKNRRDNTKRLEQT